MSINANQAHPFSPGADGMTCSEYRYPEYERCTADPDGEIHTGTRTAPLELEFPYPPCSLCGEDTYHDGDGLRCDPCGASWSSSGGGGTWDEPDALACPATHKPFDYPGLDEKYENIRHHVKWCMLPAGHDDKHRDHSGGLFEAGDPR